MKYLITSFLLFISISVSSQDKIKILKNKILEADTVIIVSHKSTYGPRIVNDNTGKITISPKLIINNKPNETIILERKIIIGNSRDTLLSILERPNKTIVERMCFMPHHAIFIIANKRISYIEICFACRQFITSKDLNNIISFDESKWIDLERFFTTHGFKYDLEQLD